MFSYLRPGHAKRSASSLASPEGATGVISPAAYALPSPSQATEYFGSPRFSDNASHVSSSPISPFPPQLPPIARVASKLERPPPPSSAAAGRPAATTTGAGATPPPPMTTLSPGASMPKERPLMPGSSRAPPTTTTATTSTPTAAPAKPKSRLNLRNPMSLLMRRRSGQTLDPLADESLVSHRSPALVPPMPANYDPSIRGHIVHDFNAPRLNRNFSYTNAYGSDQSQQEAGRGSPPKIEREHTPVFHEHFDDDTSYSDSHAAIRAEQLANNDFLARNSVQLPPPGLPPAPPPPLPKNSPPIVPSSTSSPPPRSSLGADGPSTILSPVLEAPDSMDLSTETTPRRAKPPKSPPPARSRATSMTDPAFQSAGLPSHFTSRASRFSFQISGGSDSAQEAMLEERHKQKAAEKASKQTRMSTTTLDDEYDEYGMDDYDDMDGGFEEDIPMLGEEDDHFGGLGEQSIDAGINNFDFSSLSMQPNPTYGISPIVASDYLQTPVDATGNRIGFALSEQATVTAFATNHTEISVENDLGDDMYFDDGLIGLQEQDAFDANEFDENVFDDPNGPLFDRKMKLPHAEELPISGATKPLAQAESGSYVEEQGDALEDLADVTAPSLAHKTSVVQQQPLPDFNNMDAYHSALADAATRAEAAGRFTRQPSTETGRPSPEAEITSALSDSRPSLVPDDGRFSLDTDGFPHDDDVLGMSSGFVDDYDYSDYDSNLEDDPMIAAANAEALAFDDEGFYGQEFGFYASAVGDSPNAWGGFFGPSGVGRSVSGRNAVREPNLTPITERSEYSTRNSFISLNHFRDGQQPLSSPGLAQLARMSPYGWPEEEDMSLDTLLKLRKGAFGGSATSLPGSATNSPRNSSPMGMQFVPRLSSAAGHRMVEHTDSELESDESANLADDEYGKAQMDALNASYEEDNDSTEDARGEKSESPTLMAGHYESQAGHDRTPANNLAPLPCSAELRALHSMQSPTHIALPMSPDGRPLSPHGTTSSSGTPLASPLVHGQRPTAPPSIDTSLSSPSATLSTSTGPRRSSMGLVSPISNSSPITPGGSSWRAGHSRKGSAADSVTYVRDHDETGEGRWILERRRTAESGELELIGREIVEGGRI